MTFITRQHGTLSAFIFRSGFVVNTLDEFQGLLVVAKGTVFSYFLRLGTKTVLQGMCVAGFLTFAISAVAIDAVRRGLPLPDDRSGSGARI